MKRVLIIGTVILLCLGAYFRYVQKPWTLLCPGIQTEDLEHLHGSLRKKMKNIMDTLDKEGFRYEISSTYRSPEKQECYYNISRKIQEYTGENGLTTTKRSCHNKKKGDSPESMAIDLHSSRGSIEDQAKFYSRLRALARKYNLQSGGDFCHSSSLWKQYGLGWDPGHVELPKCKGRKKWKKFSCPS